MPGALPALWEHYGQCDLQQGSAATEHLLACFHTLARRFHQVVNYRSYPDLRARERHRACLRQDAAGSAW